MKAIVFLAFLTVFLTVNQLILAKYQSGDGQIHWWDTDDNDKYEKDKSKRIPFPQCLLSKSGSKMFEHKSLQKLFDQALNDEADSLKKEDYENYKHSQDGMMDEDNKGSRRGTSDSRTAARAALKLTRNIMTNLMCDLDGIDSDNLNSFLNKFTIPGQFCSFLDKPDCDDKKDSRSITGICNNLDNPYQGSSQTAFARLVPAAYNDHLSEPRRKSVQGGYLPSCRQLSLAFGSKPIFDRKFNNFFVIFGQVIAHDIALSTPVTDTYSRPISSCQCGDKYDWDKCNVIDIAPDDPYFRGQKCMAFPATAQAFTDQICSLGVKDQVNGNTHFPDLSIVYGSTDRMAEALRSDDGLLKSTRPSWTNHELPPGQREGKSCIDATKKRKCFAGGDSRLAVNLLFTGIQTIFLRIHNKLARAVKEAIPDAKSDDLYTAVRTLNIALFQKLIYEDWLPILFGDERYKKEFGKKTQTTYKPDVKPIVSNEFATAAFRLHTLVRDLFSRCTSDGKRIDQLWFNDISQRVKYAYDIEKNGVDSILCGSFYDYGFASDANFAHQIHNRLFESSNEYGQLWRNDLVAINICRGREHGIPSYTKLREYCGLQKVYYFENFADSINTEGIKLLQKLYKDVDDVDLFVGLNLEDHIDGGLVGPTSACIIAEQFRNLRDGDRFFYSHENLLSPNVAVRLPPNLPTYCIFCIGIDIEQLPKNPFMPPSDDNPLQDCSACETHEFNYGDGQKISMANIRRPYY